MVENQGSSSVLNQIMDNLTKMSPKSQVLGNYLVQNASNAVFMTIKELAKASEVSEASVVRFVTGLGFKGYLEFQQALKEVVNTGMSLPERADLSGKNEPAIDRLHRVLLEEMSSIKYLYEIIDMEKISRLTEMISESDTVYVTGSRVSYTFSYYLGWSLTKLMKGVHILKGSDSTAIDMMLTAPDNSLVILFATTRYPNELIRLSRLVKRLNHRLIVFTDSNISPVIQFADLSLVVPSKSIPFIGNISNMMCMIQYVIHELAARNDKEMHEHQEQMEQVYLENDILFNLVPK